MAAAAIYTCVPGAAMAMDNPRESNAEVYEFQLDKDIKTAARNEALKAMASMSKEGLAAWRKDTDLDHPLYSAILITEPAEDECDLGPGRYVVVLFNKLGARPYPTYAAFELSVNNELIGIGFGFGSLMSDVIADIRSGAMACY